MSEVEFFIEKNMLSREAIDEFKQLWIEEYGRSIDDKKAERIAVKLLMIMRPIYQPIPKKDSKRYGKSK